jgi:DNA-directed RNA polymerase
LVNVIPSDKPQDAYQVIADKSCPHIPERLRPHWDRKKTKRCVMTIPYNAKPFSNRQYIKDAFKDIDIEVEKEELTQIVQAVRNAMEVVVPGPMKVMRWIESEVSKAIKNGAKDLMWVTPSGFRVTQKLMKQDWQRIQLQLFGTTNLKVSIPDQELGVDLAHHKNATAPNLIHSLDASLLHLSATRFDAPISLIHDSVLCRATDMTFLSTLVRDTYMHLFAEHDFLKDFAQAIGAETEPPIIGDLQPSEVIESTYFFC